MSDWADGLARRAAQEAPGKAYMTPLMADALRAERARCGGIVREAVEHWRGTPSALVALQEVERRVRDGAA